MTVFAGDAALVSTSGNFVFRSRSRYARLEELPVLMAKVIDALRGEALSCCHGDRTRKIDGGKWP